MLAETVSLDREVENGAVHSALAAMAALLVLLLRPSAFGEVLSLPFAAALAGVTVAALLVEPRRSIEPGAALLLGGVMLALFYAHLRATLSPGVDGDGLGKTILLDAVAVVAIAGMLSHPATRRQFFRWLAVLIVTMCGSVVVTFALMVTGFAVAQLAVLQFDYTYAGRGLVLFPLTFSFNTVSIGGLLVPRLSGIMREPGILPPLACWAATWAYFARWKLRWIAVCLVGSACSLASLGLPLALLTGALLIAYRLRWSAAAIIVCGAAAVAVLGPVLYSLEAIGIGAKIAEGSESFLVRADIVQAALGVEDVLFGDGRGWSGTAIESISLIGDIRTFGLPYALLVLWLYLAGLRRWRFWAAGISPLLATAMVSQPIALAPVALAVLCSWLEVNRDG